MTTTMRMITWTNILAVMERKGYAVFGRDDKPFNLNLVGIRAKEKKSNSFDDLLFCAYRVGGNWWPHRWFITTDPGKYWLENPMNEKGCAILKPAQNIGMFERGLHKGKYPALVQAQAVVVMRDNDLDDVLDFNSPEDRGNFGINMHRASEDGKSVLVDKWSAGCQVFADPFDFEKFMGMVDKAINYGWGNRFTYTLLEEADFDTKNS